MAQLPQEFLDDHPQLSGHERHTPRFSPSPEARRDGGYIRDLERKIMRQQAALAHVDATIQLFSPGSNPDAILPERAYRRTRYAKQVGTGDMVMVALLSSAHPTKEFFRPIRASAV